MHLYGVGLAREETGRRRRRKAKSGVPGVHQSSIHRRVRPLLVSVGLVLVLFCQVCRQPAAANVLAVLGGCVCLCSRTELSLTCPRLLVLRLGLNSHSHKPSRPRGFDGSLSGFLLRFPYQSCHSWPHHTFGSRMARPKEKNRRSERSIDLTVAAGTASTP